MSDWIEFHAWNDLLVLSLHTMHEAFQKGGENSLRELNKSKENRQFNNKLKINKTEYFPLALYLRACFPDNVKISVPYKEDNRGFDAHISLEQRSFYIEITAALFPHEGKAIKDAFLKEENKIYLKDSVNKEINRIKYVIKNKLKKSKIYEEKRPILLVEFGKIHPLTCISEEEFDLISKKIYNSIKWYKNKLKKCFSKIVLIKSLFDPFYMKQLYDAEKVITPEKYNIFTVTYNLDESPIGIESNGI